MWAWLALIRFFRNLRNLWYRQICIEHICICPDRLALNISAFLQTAFCLNQCGVQFYFNGWCFRWLGIYWGHTRSGWAYNALCTSSCEVFKFTSTSNHSNLSSHSGGFSGSSSIAFIERFNGRIPTRYFFSHSSCKFTKDDVLTFRWKSAGFHRASPYQLTDLQPGVNDRPLRAGYQPQSFRVKANPPQSLHSTSSTNLPPPPDILQRNLDQQVTPKAKTTRRRGGSTAQQIQLTRLRHPSDSPIITGKFDALLQEFGSLADVYQALQQSQFADAHRDRLLNAFGASTVFRYLQSVQQFSNTLKKLGFALTELTVTQLVDCLAVMSHARASSSDAISGNFTLKALRWFKKIAGVSCLDIVFSPLADSFLKVRLTTDKKEAPPLPLWILFHWEKRILFSQSSTFEVIMLGAFLFMTWSSLRFSDVQRLNIESLVLTEVELRGMVWRSKTRSNGHPFGITSSGLCSTGSFTWLVKFLRTWDALLAESGCATWDFLIPHLSEQGTLLSHEPLDYASTLPIFRDMLYNYTLETFFRAPSTGWNAFKLHTSQSESNVIILWTSVGVGGGLRWSFATGSPCWSTEITSFVWTRFGLGGLTISANCGTTGQEGIPPQNGTTPRGSEAPCRTSSDIGVFQETSSWVCVSVSSFFCTKFDHWGGWSSFDWGNWQFIVVGEWWIVPT